MKNTIVIVLCVFISIGWASLPERLQAAEGRTPASVFPETVTAAQVANPVDIRMGAGTVISTVSAVSRVALADETLANVMVLSPQQILLQGLLPGSTSLFVWAEDGTVTHHVLRVRLDLGVLVTVLQDIDERLRIEESNDSRSLLLQGDVDDATLANQALRRAESFLEGLPGKNRPVVMNLVKFPVLAHAVGSDMRLQEALQDIDSRIRVRRIEVADNPQKDSIILEGKVVSLRDLSRAMTLAERHLGETGLGLKVADSSRVSSSSTRSGGFGGIQGQAGNTGNRETGLANHLARRMVITSESSRVISFLEVDHIDQILVSIRVFEINRNRARQVGVNYRVDGTDFSAANLTGTVRNQLPAPAVSRGGVLPSVTGVEPGNLVGVLVRDSFSVLAAMDMMLQEKIARSVAEPNVMTLTGEQASVVVGGEIPIPITTVGQVSTVRGFGFQSFGVRLDIRPTVDDDKVVTLEVAPSIIRPDRALSVDEVPGFQVESVETTARVRDGQSLVLGGLLTYDEGITTRKVPLLGSIPILGYLFRWERRFREERELVFVITPTVLVNAEDGMGELHFPPLDSLNTGLNRERAPQALLPDGRPELWSKPPYSTMEPLGIRNLQAEPPRVSPPPSDDDTGGEDGDVAVVSESKIEEPDRELGMQVRRVFAP